MHLALVGIITAHLIATCPTTSAVYELMGYPALTADFSRMPPGTKFSTDVGLHLHSSRTNRDFWFGINRGSALWTNLAQTADFHSPNWSGHPLASNTLDDEPLQYIGMDGNLREANLDGLPTSKNHPPALILIPLLPNWLKYQNPQEFVPLSFFKIKSCRRR